MSLDEEWEASGLVGKMAAGRYLIVSELGTDHRRTLYEAEHVELGVRVTLGVVRADGTATEQRLRNGEKLRSLKQSGLVSVLDVGKLDSGELYVATERPEGTTLRALMTEKRFDQRRALRIMRQVLEALAAAHGVGAIHGDIKPENIIIAPALLDDRVKVSDFGVATLTGAARGGDPVYGAPESALGAIDARADLYSVGAVLFELLTGHPPFFADDANALRRLHAYAPMQTLKQRAPGVEFPEALETLVATALDKKRDERFQSAADMIVALDAALQVVEQAAQPPPPGERHRKPNDSLLLLAKDLMPRASGPASIEPLVPVNVDRHVPELPWSMRARRVGRRTFDRARALASTVAGKTGLRERWRKLDRMQRRIVGGVGAAVVLVLIVALVTCGGGASDTNQDLAVRAKALLDRGKKGEAIALIDREIAARPSNAGAYRILGDTQLELAHHGQALAAYEKAIALVPELATQPELVEGLSRVATSDDPATALSALELMALRSGASGHAAIAMHASSHPDGEVRRRAVGLAERAGAAAKIDRVLSWSLDLEQASSCEERAALIGKLAKAGDARAVPALQRAKAHKCVERDAVSAIQRVEAASKR